MFFLFTSLHSGNTRTKDSPFSRRRRRPLKYDSGSKFKSQGTRHIFCIIIDLLSRQLSDNAGPVVAAFSCRIYSFLLFFYLAAVARLAAAATSSHFIPNDMTVCIFIYSLSPSLLKTGSREYLASGRFKTTAQLHTATRL